MEGFEELRQVGRLERYSTARHSLGYYLNVAVAASYTLPQTCSLPLKSYIYDACRSLIGQHPILSAIPVREDSNLPQFVRLPEVDLDKCVFFQERSQGAPGSTADESESSTTTDVELDELLKAQHNTGFAPPAPFWRLCVLTSPADPCFFTAAFIFHHALGDGASGPAFHRTFHQALTRAAAADASALSSAPVVASPQTKLLPTAEDLHPMPVSTLYLLTILFRTKVWSSRGPALWTGPKVGVPNGTQLRHYPFSRADTCKLKDACRAHGTTITAALQTVVAGALFKHIPEKFNTLGCNGVLSTRRWLSETITDDDIGVFFQDFQEIYSKNAFTEGILPWNEAKRSRETIERVLALQGKNASVNLLRYVSNYHDELFRSKVGGERGSSFHVSNLGVFNSPDKKDTRVANVAVGRMVFTQSANVTGSVFSVSVVTGGDGCMVLGVSWQKDVVDDALIQQVMDTVKLEIQQLGSSP